MLYLGVILAALCLALCVIAVVSTGREHADVTEDAVQPAERVREEDVVRPTIDADGRPTWVPAGEVVWHEIVRSPTPKTDAPEAGHTRHRPA